MERNCLISFFFFFFKWIIAFLSFQRQLSNLLTEAQPRRGAAGRGWKGFYPFPEELLTVKPPAPQAGAVMGTWVSLGKTRFRGRWSIRVHIKGQCSNIHNPRAHGAGL